MNAASASSYSSIGGGIPVPAGQLTLIFGAFGRTSATSAGLAAAPAPLPAINETIAGNFAGLQGADAVAGANVSESISALSTTFFASNAKEASPVANAGGSLSASSSLPGTTGSASLINGHSGGNSGSWVNLSAIATANIANPAPNSIFLEPDQVFSQPETIAFNPFEGPRELPGSAVPEAIGVPAPAEATDNAAGEVDIHFSFDVAVFPTDQPVSAPFTDPTVLSAGAATGSDIKAPKIGPVTTSDSISPIDTAHGSDPGNSVAKLVILSSMLATYSADLAFGGAISRYGTMSWAARRWPATRRSKGEDRPSPKLRLRSGQE
jgi:hypothetical protein